MRSPQFWQVQTKKCSKYLETFAITCFGLLKGTFVVAIMAAASGTLKNRALFSCGSGVFPTSQSHGYFGGKIDVNIDKMAASKVEKFLMLTRKNLR